MLLQALPLSVRKVAWIGRIHAHSLSNSASLCIPKQALIDLLKSLKERNIGFISLTEQIDTTTPGGMLIFHLMGALAEFERDLIRERTNAGLAAARARGHRGGRPRKLKTNGKVALARHMFADQTHSVPEMCAVLGVSRATLYRYVKEAESPE
jgi:DNA invertase Pin-like site-specific DNA recombinase